MMHAKTFVVDGVWSTVGSLNFDNRSLVFNNESNLVALDERVGASLDSLFLSDLALLQGDQAGRVRASILVGQAARMGCEHAAAGAVALRIPTAAGDPRLARRHLPADVRAA